MTTYKKQSIDLFVEILFPINSVSSQNLSGYSYEDLYSLSNKHQLFPLIFHRLNAINVIAQIPSAVEPFLEQRREVYLNVVAHSLRLEAQEKEIISLLQSEGFPALVFKGTAIARELFDDPNIRASVDIDILVKQNDIFQIDQILCNACYEREGSLPFKYLFHRIQHATYKKGDKRVPVDVHWTFGIPWFFDLSSEKIWDNVALTDDGVYKLSPDMLIIMLLMHHHLHFYRELRVLVDLLWAFEKYSESIDFKELAVRLQKIGLLRTVQLVLNQFHDIWGNQVNEIKGVHKLDDELSRVNVKVPHWLNSYFRMEIEQPEPYGFYKDKFYSRLILDSWLAIINSYFKTLFPPAEAIKALYDGERTWMLPVNYLRFVGWRVKDWLKVKG